MKSQVLLSTNEIFYQKGCKYLLVGISLLVKDLPNIEPTTQTNDCQSYISLFSRYTLIQPAMLLLEFISTPFIHVLTILANKSE